MPLNDLQREKFSKWLMDKGISPACPSCGMNPESTEPAPEGWFIPDIVGAPVLVTEAGAKQVGGDPVPMVQMICLRCGGIRFFSADAAGLGRAD